MASVDEETAKKIKQQVEFYFSDSNLPRDQFLRKRVSQSKDDMVSLALICSFSRMRNVLNLCNVKCEDIPESILEAVAEILRQSKFLKVSDDGKRIGRITEFSQPEKLLEQVDRRTIAVSPFEYDVTIEDLESFFAQYGKVNSVRLPHHFADKRCFCGTALIEFSVDVDAEEVLKQKLVCAGANLVLKPKKHFDCERGKMEGSSDKDGHNTISNRWKGVLVAFSLKRKSLARKVKKNEEPQNDKHEVKEHASKGNSKNFKETITRRNEEKTSEDDICHPLDKSFEDVCQEIEKKESRAQESMTFDSKNDIVCGEDLKDVFQRFGVVKHVDYTPGADSGYICFEEPEAAIKARAAAEFLEEGALIVKKTFFASLEAVNGEAEREYWKSFQNNQEGHLENGGGSRWKRKRNKEGRGLKGKCSSPMTLILESSNQL